MVVSGVDGTDDLLTPRLGREELGGRVALGVVGRDVDESVHVVLGNSLGDALGAVNVDVGVGEVPARCYLRPSNHDSAVHSLGGILPTNKVVDDIGVTDTLFDGLGVVQIVLLRAVRLCRLHLITGLSIQGK